MTSHPLDRVGSQALRRLAAQRGLAPVPTPTAEDTARKPRASWWSPALRIALFGVSLVSLAAMALGLRTFADGGWTAGDAVEATLMALLVAGVVSQGWVMLRTTRPIRRLSRRRARPAPTAHATGPLPTFILDAVRAEDLPRGNADAVPGQRRGTAAVIAARRFSDRASVVVILLLAALTAASAVGGLCWAVYAAGPMDPAALLGAPFAALTTFGVFQTFRSAQQLSFRGRPLALLSRTFRGVVRAYEGASLATRVAVTATATASVAGVAALPVLAPQDTAFDVFALDTATAVVYRIDARTNTSAPTLLQSPAPLRPAGFGTTTAQVRLGEGRALPRYSLLVVLEGAAGEAQGVVAFRPGSSTPQRLAQLSPALPGARFTGGPGRLHALQPDGALWHVDLRTGAASRVGAISSKPGPITYDESTGTLLMVSGNDLIRLDPGTGAESSRTRLGGALAEAAICAIADGPADSLLFGIEGAKELVVLDGRTQALSRAAPAGEQASTPCLITAAYRRE